MHTTNYINTFIEIAADCPVEQGVMPPEKAEKKSIANFQFEMIWDHPYEYTSDEVLFAGLAERKAFEPFEMEEQKAAFFSKGQACFRASPLTKTYGWGVHHNAEGKMAIYAAGTAEYQAFLADEQVKKVKAMRSKKA